MIYSFFGVRKISTNRDTPTHNFDCFSFAAWNLKGSIGSTLRKTWQQRHLEMSKNVEIPLKSLNFNSFRRLRLNFHEIPCFHLLCSLLIVVVAMHHTFVIYIYIYIYLLICIYIMHTGATDVRFRCRSLASLCSGAAGTPDSPWKTDDDNSCIACMTAAWQLHDSTTNISSWRNSPHITWTPHGHHMPWRNHAESACSWSHQPSSVMPVPKSLSTPEAWTSVDGKEMSRNVKKIKRVNSESLEVVVVSSCCWLLKRQKYPGFRKEYDLKYQLVLGCIDLDSANASARIKLEKIQVLLCSSSYTLLKL